MPDKRRGKYLGFVAHEIKNPLATVLWSTDLLKRMQPAERGSERGEKMIDVSLRALRRMRRLVDDFFTIERLLEQGYDLRRETIAIRELVNGALTAAAEKDGISTSAWAVELNGGSMACDGEMMRRALRALFEYMARPSGKLSISARDGGILIRAETPPSPLIPPLPEDRPTGDATGAVLGFALAAAVIEAHGGRIEERDGALYVSLPIGA